MCIYIRDSENDHKNANGLQSEVFQKLLEDSLQVDVENGKTLLVIANGHVTITSLHTPCLENEESSCSVSFFASQFDFGLSVELSVIVREHYCVPSNCKISFPEFNFLQAKV